jgi:hypothetical protein
MAGPSLAECSAQTTLGFSPVRYPEQPNHALRCGSGNVYPWNTKGGSINVPLTSCLTGLGLSVLQIKTKMVSCHTADCKPVKQVVSGTVILPLLVLPGIPYTLFSPIS